MKITTKLAIASAAFLLTSVSAPAFAQNAINVNQSMFSNANAVTNGFAHNVCCSATFTSTAGLNESNVAASTPSSWNNTQLWSGNSFATTNAQVSNVNGNVDLGARAFGSSATGNFSGNCCVSITSLQATVPQPRPVDPSATVNGVVSNIGGNATAVAQASGNTLGAFASNASMINANATQLNGAITMGSVNFAAQNIGGNAMAASTAFGNGMSFMGGENTRFNITGNQSMTAPVSAFTNMSAQNIGGHVFGSSTAIANSFNVGRGN